MAYDNVRANELLLAKQVDNLDSKIADALGDEVAFIMLARADVLALVELLVKKGLITSEESIDALIASRKQVLQSIEEEAAKEDTAGQSSH